MDQFAFQFPQPAFLRWPGNTKRTELAAGKPTSWRSVGVDPFGSDFEHRDFSAFGGQRLVMEQTKTPDTEVSRLGFEVCPRG
jgi:hypothetical protein